MYVVALVICSKFLFSLVWFCNNIFIYLIFSRHIDKNSSSERVWGMGIGKYINRFCSVMDTKVVGPLLKGASGTSCPFLKNDLQYTK